MFFVTVSCTATGTANQTININSASAVNTNSAIITAPTAEKSAQSEQATTPEALVADLYKQHDAKKSPFFQTDDRARIDKYFVKRTADMIWKDALESRGETGALEADPLYNAQDTEIKNFAVGKAVIKGERAEVPVSFENFGEKQTLTFLLAKENGNWKIENIRYPEMGNLTDFFKNSVSKTDGYSESKKAKTGAVGEFEGKYQIGDTTCTVKPVKMAFEVRWAKGSGVEMFFFESRDNDRYIFASHPEKGKANVFAFDDENYNTGTFYRADGKEFPIKRAE